MRHSPGLLCLVLLALVCLSRARYSVKVREVLDEGTLHNSTGSSCYIVRVRRCGIARQDAGSPVRARVEEKISFGRTFIAADSVKSSPCKAPAETADSVEVAPCREGPGSLRSGL